MPFKTCARGFRSLAVAVLALAGSVAAEAASGPDSATGWIRPSEQDIAGADRRYRTEHQDRYLRTSGDFDGDGRSDRAELLVNREGSSYGLFVFMAGRPPVKVLERPLAELSRVGVDAMAPGTYRTACGRGYGSAEAPCEPTVHVPHDAISIFVFESASQIAFWDEDEFRIVFLTD